MNTIQRLPLVKSEIVNSISIKLDSLIAKNIKLIDFDANNLNHYLLFIEFMLSISLLENELKQFESQQVKINQNNYKDCVFINELETKFVMKEFYSKKNLMIAIHYYLFNNFGLYFDTQIILNKNIFISCIELIIICIQSNTLKKQSNMSNSKILAIIAQQLQITMYQNVEFYNIDKLGMIIILYKTIPLDIPTLQIQNLVPSDKSYIKLGDIAKLTKDTPKLAIGTGKPNVIYPPFSAIIAKPINKTKIIDTKKSNKLIKPLIFKPSTKTNVINQKINQYIILSSNIEEYSLGIDCNTIWMFPPKISVQILNDKFEIEQFQKYITEIDKKQFVSVQCIYGIRINTYNPIHLKSFNKVSELKLQKTEQPILKKNKRDLFLTSNNKLDFNLLFTKQIISQLKTPIDIKIISTNPKKILKTNLFIVNHPELNINGFYCGCKLKDLDNINVRQFIIYMEQNKYHMYDKLYTERNKIIQMLYDFHYNKLLPYIELFIVKSDLGFNLKLNNNEETEMVQNYKLNVNKYPNKSINELIPNLPSRYKPIKDIKVADIIKVFINNEKIINYLLNNLVEITEFNVIEFLVIYEILIN